MLRFHYNSPVVLTFSLICTAVFLGNTVTAGVINQLFTLSPYFSFTNPLSYFTLFSHIFGHADAQHLLSNLSFILLLGPILEEKYGKSSLIFMILATAFITSILNLLLFNSGLLGASGIVFMFIMLVSFANFKAGKIPLTFVLIFALFVGKEVFNSFAADQVSQFAHIIGGIVGSLFGFSTQLYGNKK